MKSHVVWALIAMFGLGPLFVRADPAAPGNSFRFRLPQPVSYRRVESKAAPDSVPVPGNAEWLRVVSEHDPNQFAELGSRLVVQLKSPQDLQSLIAGRSLALTRVITSNVFILQAPDSSTAAGEAHRLAALPEVTSSYPVMRRQADLHGPYADQPIDSLFSFQWPLEHRNGDGSSAGVDVNVRAAWPYSTGDGIIVAIADSGIEMNHVELTNSVVGAPHYNFVDQTTNGMPASRSSSAAHGTEVAGLVAAQRNTARMVGVAPGAKLASWVIFDSNMLLAGDDRLMEMYQYASNSVAVQNHSWGSPGLTLGGPTLLEQLGISNAIAYGRSGLGTILVRSVGNDREAGANANDGYASDPHVIAVAAANINGRAANYSEPGACILVAAPSGDATTPAHGLFTTDLLGGDGANEFLFLPPNVDLSDYNFFNQFTGTEGFSGTSAAAPQVAGIAALMLAANPNLSYRDVQQILVLASRHIDFADPDLTTNGAGFRVSHNVGFGVPDAGMAANLARNWTNRPPMTSVAFSSVDQLAIPDDGLRVIVTGNDVPQDLTSIHTLPSGGPHADTPTAILPLVDFGFGTTTSGFNLTNKAALIQRGANTFADKIILAAQAGAAFAIIYNYPSNLTAGGDQLVPLGGTDFVPIPAVFIGNTDGEALKALFQTNATTLVHIQLNSTSHVFTVTNTLLCEHVGVRVMTDHPLRGDLRITLVSPSGTRSVLQRYNGDTSPGPEDWTYYSTHHFYESSAGNWEVYFSDEGQGNSGTVQSLSLIISGVQLSDTDNDGLHDPWELTYFGDLTQWPNDDPDHDGYSNLREQIMGTNPKLPVPLQLDLSRWNTRLARLSWPGSPQFTYEVWGGTNIASPSLLASVPGHFPETEWFTPYNNLPRQFLQVRAVRLP
jgi:subtilisin family serine protease/subtilisin-like proprotein convertase family protein